MLLDSNITGVTSGVGTANPPGTNIGVNPNVLVCFVLLDQYFMCIVWEIIVIPFVLFI
jgi:hypothetical protein